MVSATPESSVFVSQASTTSSVSTSSVKAATPEIILNSTVEDSSIAYLFLENIASKELISIVRGDVVSGKSIAYSPIKNLSSVGARYSSKNIVSLQGSSDTFFENFPIKLERKVPEIGTGPFGQVVYIDPATNDLIVNVINLAEDERVEVQIMKRGEVLDDTIYTEGTI